MRPREHYTNERDAVPAGATGSRGLGTLTKLHVWLMAGRSCVLCVCLMCAWGSYRSAHAAFSVSTAKPGQMQTAPGRDNCKGQNYRMTNAFYLSSVAAYCLVLRTRELHEFWGGPLLLRDAFTSKNPITTKTFLSLPVGLIFWP